MRHGVGGCALLNLGGTIGEIYGADGLAHRASARMLYAAADLPTDWPGHDVALVDSVDLTFTALQRVADIIAADRTSAGFILCCGTDLLEEVAYAASLLLPADRPIVVTAAALPASEAGSDGPGNLRRAAALIAAADIGGTMIVMGDAIFAPAGMTKIEPQSMQPFVAADGPIGRFRAGVPCLVRSLEQDDQFLGLAPRECTARVAILHECLGGTDRFVDPTLLDGLVVAGAGAGGVSSGTLAMLCARYVPAMPVVLSTRCAFGFMVNPAMHKHAHRSARAAGLLVDDYVRLSAVQARIRLILEIRFITRRGISDGCGTLP